jgi:hypothetical protein
VLLAEMEPRNLVSTTTSSPAHCSTPGPTRVLCMISRIVSFLFPQSQSTQNRAKSSRKSGHSYRRSPSDYPPKLAVIATFYVYFDWRQMSTC